MENKEKSYLDKAPRVIFFLILLFIVLALTSKDEGSVNITQMSAANISQSDIDKDGIENKMDPCINSESQIADADKDGCADVYGRIKETYYQLDQINPICKDEKCNSLIKRIAQIKNSLRPILNVKFWKTANSMKCKTPDIDRTLAKTKTKLEETCPGYEECKEIKGVIVKAIKNVSIARREHIEQECK